MSITTFAGITEIFSNGSGGGGGSTADFPLLFVVDQKSSATNGGTFTAGAWRTRDLGPAIINEISGASVASNKVTLPAGTYKFFAAAPAYNVSGHVARLYNITDSVEVGGPGQNAYSSSAQTNSEVWGEFTIDAEKSFELQHQSTGTSNNIGFGVGNGIRSVEIYSMIWLWKVV